MNRAGTERKWVAERKEDEEEGKSQIPGQIALQKGLTIRGRRTNRD